MSINLLACIWFMVSAVAPIYLPSGQSEEAIRLALFSTLSGACCFLIGAVLLLPEAASDMASGN